IFGPLGSVLGGLTSDYLSRRGYDHSTIIVGTYAALLCGFCSVVACFGGTEAIILSGLCGYYFFGSSAFGLAFTALIGIAPNFMRAQVTATFIMLSNVVGGAFAATFVALITDFVFMDQAKAYISLSIVS